MATITWPAVLKARSWDAHLRNMMASGGRSGTGRDQRVVGDGGFWEVAISGIRVSNREETAAYRALIARLRAGDDILVPVRDLYQAVGARLTGSVAALSANAALRATTLSLTVTGVDVQPGHHLTIGDRLYLVTETVSGPPAPPLINQFVTGGPIASNVPFVTAVTGSAAYTVKVLPPTRADLTAGEPARFDDLLVRCVLKDPADGDLDLALGRIGAPSLTFIESL
jgi:hypothetical protein